MSGTLSTRWFWSDWMSDTGVRASSLAARGLWSDLLALAGMNKGRDHGFVLVNGKIPTIEALAKLVGAIAAEVEPLIAELEDKGVFSRDRRKAIYCRRMVRSEKARSNGRLGGNPNLLKTKETPNPVQLDPKPPIPKPIPRPKERTSSATTSSSKPRRMMKPKVPKAGKPQLPLPDRWRLSERALKFAKERGFEGARALDLATRFESYHRSKGSTSADWECSWQTWVMNDIKFTERKNGEDLNGKPRQSGGERLTHSVLAAQLRASIASRQH